MKTIEKVQKTEREVIVDGLRKYGRKAYDETLANGIPVTVLRGNKICRIEPNGNTTIVAKVSQTKFKVSQKTFRLK
ncbi:MAG TPA: hypothetical protein VGK10_07505 [Prolixibacteraceae bacterium]|jgi:phosphosulfolactate phosphohydrolase-like enzyme